MPMFIQQNQKPLKKLFLDTNDKIQGEIKKKSFYLTDRNDQITLRKITCPFE